MAIPIATNLCLNSNVHVWLVMAAANTDRPLVLSQRMEATMAHMILLLSLLLLACSSVQPLRLTTRHGAR